MTFLSNAENRASFFARIERFYPSLDKRYMLIEKAYNDAKDAFRFKTRDTGERYFEHLRSVALILIVWLRITDYRVIVAAILHDIIEDCEEWTIERVVHEYGIEIAEMLQWLTKPDIELFRGNKMARNDFYYKRFANAPRMVVIIKLADRLHNLTTLWECTPEKQARKIAETREFLFPLAEREIVLVHEMEEAIEVLEAA